MELIRTKSELQARLNEARQTGLVGLVPTMGALHQGHLSLVLRSCSECDVTVVSIFVNPTQFNDSNDLRNYPRNLEADMALLETTGTDYVFAPEVEEMYPEEDTRVFDFGQVDKVMEGACRPGHFNGVGQIVSKLFMTVCPDKAFFGEKDFQQIAVIKEMVRQMGLMLEIVECPIVREDDGLAMSSRNALLDAEHRKAAPHIWEVLSAAPSKVPGMAPAELCAWVSSEIDSCGLLSTIYFQAVDAVTMQQVDSWDQAERIQGCVAVQAGAIRLIDNVRLK